MPPTYSTGFHVVRWFADGMVAVRRRIQRREPRGHVTPAFDPEVFRSRFLALRRPIAWARPRPPAWRPSSPPTPNWAWAMLQELHGLYLAADDAAAMECLDRFSRLYAEDPLPEFYKVVDTLLHWSPAIFAFHKAGRISNGRLDGTNNKLGVLKRMAFGVRQRGQLRSQRAAPVPAGAVMTVPTKRADPTLI